MGSELLARARELRSTIEAGGVIALVETGHTGWTMGVVRRAIDEA